MVYDRADLHYEGDYPSELPPEHAGRHIGIFLMWIIQHGLEGKLHRDESAASLEAVRRREMNGVEFLQLECDNKFWDDDLNEEGNAFARDYYDSDQYLRDYALTLCQELPSIYHAEHNWQVYDKMAVVIDMRYREWKSAHPEFAGPSVVASSPWWKFWAR